MDTATTVASPRPARLRVEDRDLRALADAELGLRLDEAVRALRFHQACDCNGEMAAERFWRRTYARLRLEAERRRGPLLQAAGTLSAKVESCLESHEAALASLTREAQRLAEAQRAARRRARHAAAERERRAHCFDAQAMAGQLMRLNRSRRKLRTLIVEAEAALALAATPVESHCALVVAEAAE